MAELKEAFKSLKGKGGKIIILLGIIGIILIFISSLNDQKSPAPSKSDDSVTSYCETLEGKIGEIVKSITGSERVSVIITLESGTQYVYADEGRSIDSGDKNDTQQTYAIIKGENGGESGLLVTEYMPVIRGVAIVCDAFTPDAEARVLAAVKAALDISEKKIYVTQDAY